MRRLLRRWLGVDTVERKMEVDRVRIKILTQMVNSLEEGL